MVMPQTVSAEHQFYYSRSFNFVSIVYTKQMKMSTDKPQVASGQRIDVTEGPNVT